MLPKCIEYLSIWSFGVFRVVRLSGHTDAGHTDMICGYRVEEKRFASLSSPNIKL